MVYKPKTKYINSKKLVEELKALGVPLKIETLRAWASSKKEFITAPMKKRPVGRPPGSPRLGDKRGRPELLWKRVVVEEAAAVWALGDRHGKRSVTKNTIDAVKDVAACAYRYPSTFYDPPKEPHITGPDPTSQWTQLKKPWPRWTTMINPNDELNELATTWIAALEKAKRDVPVSKPKRVIFHWRSRPREEEKMIPLGRLCGYNVFAIGGPDARERIEASKASRDQDLPSSFFITDPQDPDGGPLGFPQEYTRMVVSPDAPHGWDLFPVQWAFDIEKIELEDALHDEIVFLLDGHDSRIKAFYAPYDAYDPSVDYEKRASGPDRNGHDSASRNAEIDSVIEESRSLIDAISPLLADIDREHVNQRIISSVLRLIPATYMHRIRWSAPPSLQITAVSGTSKLRSLKQSIDK